MTEEKKLLKKAEAGDIESIKKLANYYDKKSGRWREEPKVGESISIDEFFANADTKADEDYLAEAFKWFMRGAELGDAECMDEVGHRIYDAIGCCKDEEWTERGKKSFQWHLKAAQAGYVPAMRITAYMYDGLCVEKDEVQSFHWYFEAAKHGDKKSVGEVAKRYAKGAGVEKNIDEANKYLAKLDAEDYRHVLHELSCGDDEESLMWLERLVELDDPLALKKKAEACCKRGDYSQALELFIKAGTSDSDGYNPDILAEALFQAGNLYYTGEGTIRQNYRRALSYYRSSAKKKYIKAYVQCGKIYFDSGNYKSALMNFNLAIKTRDRYPFGSRYLNTIALEYIGRIAENGLGVDRDIEMAYKYYEAAAKDTRNQGIIFRLANDYFYGNNVEVDTAKALSYFEEAGRYSHNEYYFEANLKLAWIYELGQGDVEKDLAKADEYWAKLPPECKPARAQ